MLGNGLSQLPLTALALFVPLVFLQVGWDFVLVDGLLVVANAILLAVLPPPTVAPTTVGIVIGGSIAAGTMTGFTLLVFRARLSQSLAWWQEACARERALREFAEATSAHLSEGTVLDELAERFRRVLGEDGRCTVVLDSSAGFQVVAAAGFLPEVEARLRGEPLPATIGTFLAQVIAERRPVTRAELSEVRRNEIAGRWRHPVSAKCLVVLPLKVEDVTAGAVVLSAPTPRTISPEEELLWQAMASEMAVAVANTQLLARLREALRAKSEFLNTMSHELRSPLHVIVGYTDMVREEGVPAAAVQALDRVRASALELLQLVENTMNAGRLEAGKVALQVEEFAPGELARELADSIEALPEASHGVEVRWEVAADLPRVRLDRLKVKEIVQNLVSNALKFTPAGEVHVSIGRDGDRLRIAVRDTGVGIPAESQPRIFGMFERVEDGDAARPPGAGLGLYIVSRLIELMQGRAALESAPGRGSCFTVQLPLRLEA